jgi:hypothetical protein
MINTINAERAAPYITLLSDADIAVAIADPLVLSESPADIFESSRDFHCVKFLGDLRSSSQAKPLSKLMAVPYEPNHYWQVR